MRFLNFYTIVPYILLHFIYTKEHINRVAKQVRPAKIQVGLACPAKLLWVRILDPPYIRASP